nr:hypothetical protein [Tanacetum cinerariifolium]
VPELENREQEKAKEMDKMKKRLGTLKENYSLVLSDRDEWKKAFFNLQAWVSERLGRGALDVRPDIGDDGPVSFGESKPPKLPGSPSKQVFEIRKCAEEDKVMFAASTFEGRALTCSEIREVKRRIDKMDQDLGDEMQFSNVVEHRVPELENREHEKAKEMDKMKKRLGTLKENYSLVLSDRDEWKKAFFNLQAWVSERLGRGALDVRPDIGDDGPVSFGESKPPKLPGSPSSSQ